jgi:alpha-L-rhamnosidase
MYGTLSTAWRLDGRRFVLDVTVPPNTTADVILPGSTAPATVGSGTYEFTKEP